MLTFSFHQHESPVALGPLRPWLRKSFLSRGAERPRKLTTHRTALLAERLRLALALSAVATSGQHGAKPIRLGVKTLQIDVLNVYIIWGTNKQTNTEEGNTLHYRTRTMN